MFSFFAFVHRNGLHTNIRKAYKYHKAIRTFRKTHKTCAWCGRHKKVDVHHILPVAQYPERAEDETNMIMLCRKPQCHLQIGHNGNYRTRYVANVRELCISHQVVKTDA